MLTHAELLQLKRWNTPTIYNGWEQITKHDHAHEGVNLEEVRDFMPQMGPMVGYAVTLVVEPGNPKHKENAAARGEYLKYVASIPAPRSWSSRISTSQTPSGLSGARCSPTLTGRSDASAPSPMAHSATSTR